MDLALYVWIGIAALVVALALVAVPLLGRRARGRGEAARRSETAPPEKGVPPAASPAARLRAALARSRSALGARLDEVLRRGGERDALFAGLEEVLVGADVGMATTDRILDELRRSMPSRAGEAQVRSALRSAIVKVLADGAAPGEARPRPWVILVIGVNGVGKTTTIGKLATLFRAQGKKALLVAADTFRAAAIDQLCVWAERAGAEVVRHQHGADPAAVAFDGVQAAVARAADVVLVDTAGRLHTRENLIEELRKVARVIGRALPGAPHDVWLILDATTGQNALRQTEVFSRALGLTGVILTKLDGTAKGGAALAVRQTLGVPIRYVGVGEGPDDLRPFSAEDYAAALLGDAVD